MLVKYIDALQIVRPSLHVILFKLLSDQWCWHVISHNLFVIEFFLSQFFFIVLSIQYSCLFVTDFDCLADCYTCCILHHFTHL